MVHPLLKFTLCDLLILEMLTLFMLHIDLKLHHCTTNNAHIHFFLPRKLTSLLFCYLTWLFIIDGNPDFFLSLIQLQNSYILRWYLYFIKDFVLFQDSCSVIWIHCAWLYWSLLPHSVDHNRIYSTFLSSCQDLCSLGLHPITWRKRMKQIVTF